MSPVTNRKWQNWAGNQQATPHRVATPRTAGEVAAQIRSAADDGLTVRMTGTGHSFTGAAVTEGVLLRPTALTAVRSVDTATGLVTVDAGLPLHELNRVLDEHGLALANMGDIEQQTVSGAIQTATHGTGRDAAGLVSQVAALELALADGTIVTCSREERPHLFDAARVGLGALGIITAVTWRTVPSFLLRAREGPMKWNEVLARVDEFDAANEHFEFYWFPHTEGCLIKRNNRAEGPAEPLSHFRYWLDDQFMSNTVFGAVNEVTHRAPAITPLVNGISVKVQASRTYTDTSYKVFTSPRRIRFKEQEYAIPREELVPALRGLRSLFAKKGWKISFPIEVRVLPQEGAWLSMAHGRHSAFIAVHVYHRDPHEDYFRGVEELLTEFDGRPHWGKLHTRDAASLEKAYPRFSDFCALRDELDPDRRFANPYTRRIFGD